jgi:flagellar hook-associated protein 2
MALSSPGIGTGLDVNNIVSQLMSVESRPLTRLDQKEAAYQAQLSAYGTLKSALSELQSAIGSLRSGALFRGFKATSSDPAVLSASATGRAATGSYSLQVSQLAQAQSLAVAGQASITSAIGSGASTQIRFEFGTISGGTLSGGVYTGASFAQNGKIPSGSVTIDATNNSLGGIRDAINSANLGVKASIVGDGSATPYRLVLQPAQTGAAASMRITVTGDATLQTLLGYDPAGAQNLTQSLAAQDASVTINGLAITSASNTLSEAIEGVTLNLAKTGSATLTLARDEAAIQTAVASFVKAYNELNTTLAQLGKYDPASKESGPLNGDAVLRSVQARLRATLSGTLGGDGLATLSQAGIAFQRDGSLKLDAAKLASVASTRAAELEALFAAAGRASDPLVTFESQASGTKPGTYALQLTQTATQGSLTGSGAANLTIAAGVNDQLTVNVNGVAANISLIAGTYTAASLAAMLQAAINGSATLAAQSAQVRVTQSGGILTVTSTRYGSASSVQASGAAGAGLFGATPLTSAGVDVAGTIGSAAATGSGQVLTSTAGAAEGLKVSVNGGVIGDRGTITVGSGFADRLVRLLDEMLSSSGSIASRTDGIGRSIRDIDTRREALNRRLADIEKRYRAQFTELDGLISRLQATSTFLSQQLAKLPDTTSNN